MDDHDLLIRMDTKLDIFIRQQEFQAQAIKTLGERFEEERNKVWFEIGKIQDDVLAKDSFNKGRSWAFGFMGALIGAIPVSTVLALIALL